MFWVRGGVPEGLSGRALAPLLMASEDSPAARSQGARSSWTQRPAVSSCGFAIPVICRKVMTPA